MKAATWQRWISIAIGVLAVSAVAQLALAATPAPPPPADRELPAGLPALPVPGETMGRDLRSGLALGGFDPLGYRLSERPVAGRPEYELIIDGIVWRFASAANREAFREAPAIYAPAFSGLDPTALARGIAVDGDPATFAIVGPRLFLFGSDENRRHFLRDERLLGAAEARWPEVARSTLR